MSVGNTSSAPSRRYVIAGASCVLAVILAIYLGRAALGGAESSDLGAAPSGSVGASSSSVAAEESVGGDEPVPVDPGDSLADAVREAMRDGYPAMVPAATPTGWTVVSGDYDPASGWHLEMVSASGSSVTVDQRAAKVEEMVVALHGDLAPSQGVNLDRWGTGRWVGYEGTDLYVIATSLPSTAVVVSGASRDDVVALAKQLLTAEDALPPTED